MTPMVDVAFLLLIFFMCTTVFRKPQALEINLPPDPNAKVEIAESNVMTLRVVAGAANMRRGARAVLRGGSETRPGAEEAKSETNPPAPTATQSSTLVL